MNEITDVMDMIAEFLGAFLFFGILLLTLPIWIIPYLIFRNR